MEQDAIEWPVTAPYPQPTMTLTTSQIETLAKAGVKVELAHPVIVRNDDPPTPTRPGSPELLDMVRGRWMMAMRAKYTNSYGDFNETFAHNPLLCAAKHGDKVYVFVVGPNTAPHVIEDEIAIFPSDALLAKLHLMMEFGNGA